MEDVELAWAGFAPQVIYGIPRFGSSWTESGDVCLYGLVKTEVADNLIDLDDDVLGDLGLHRLAIDHLDKGDALVIGLCDRHLAEYLEFVGNDDAD